MAMTLGCLLSDLGSIPSWGVINMANIEDKFDLDKLPIDERFRHCYNPMHMMCRVAELGVPTEEAMKLILEYQDRFYKPLMNLLKKQDYRKV